MAKVIVTKSKLDALNSAISAKCGTSTTRTIDSMTSAVASIAPPGTWESGFLSVHRTSVTVGENSVTTTPGVKDYLLSESDVDTNRLLGFALRGKQSYSEGEIGRAVMYANSSINYFSVLQYKSGAWTTGRMSDSYSAALVPGSVYDVFYWSV